MSQLNSHCKRFLSLSLTLHCKKSSLSFFFLQQLYSNAQVSTGDPASNFSMSNAISQIGRLADKMKMRHDEEISWLQPGQGNFCSSWEGAYGQDPKLIQINLLSLAREMDSLPGRRTFFPVGTWWQRSGIIYCWEGGRSI